jgi:hypothetical protein
MLKDYVAGPWMVEPNCTSLIYSESDGCEVATVEGPANAVLISQAPASDLILRLMLCGAARIDSSTQEFCFDGMRYSCGDMDWNGLLAVIGWRKARMAVRNTGREAP